MQRKTKVSIAALGAIGAFLLFGATSCDSWNEPFNDAPRSKVTNGDAADIVTFPDGFSNWSTKCDHGNRIYSAYHGDTGPWAAGLIVPKDATCPQPAGR
jgi:hypothetical protein